MKTIHRILCAALLLVAGFGCTQRAAAQTSFGCNHSTNYASASLTASTQLIAVPTNIPGLAIHICSYTVLVSQGSTAVTFGLVSGTGTACATGNALVTPLYPGIASSGQQVSEVYDADGALNIPAGTNLCLQLSGAPTGAVVHITWAAY
jgi:hypothetical protein